MIKKYAKIKEWFLIKNNKYASNNNDLINGYKFNQYSKFYIKKETEKAVLINANGDLWCPKSALLEIIETREGIEIVEKRISSLQAVNYDRSDIIDVAILQKEISNIIELINNQDDLTKVEKENYISEAKEIL